MRRPLPPSILAALPPLIAFAALALALSGLTGCSSSSFCGAPCEKPPQKPAPRKAAPKDTAPPVVNQYGSFYGHMDLDSMTKTQLKVERSSLEVLLSLNDKDKEILKVLREGKLDTTTFDYDDYSMGGSRYDASGKLRRDAATKVDALRLPRMISESQNREIIERYRQVRRRISLLPDPPPPVTPVEPPRPAPPDTDSVWTGSYRASGDTAVAAPGSFRGIGECEAWGRERAEAFRNKAYGFEYECRKRPERVKRKIW
jgi:hypothetical protein